jgi:hypothetical protein
VKATAEPTGRQAIRAARRRERRPARETAAESGPPDVVEDLPIPTQGRGGQIIAPNACLAVGEVFIESVMEQPNFDASQAPE